MLDHPQTPLSIISRNLFARDYSRKHSDRITYTTCTHLMRVIRREAMAAQLVDLESRFVIWSICSWKRPSFVHNNNKTANSPFSRTAKGLKTREINRSRERKKKFPGFSSAPIQTQSSSFPPFFCAPFSRSDPDICSLHTRLKAVSWTTAPRRVSPNLRDTASNLDAVLHSLDSMELLRSTRRNRGGESRTECNRWCNHRGGASFCNKLRSPQPLRSLLSRPSPIPRYGPDRFVPFCIPRPFLPTPPHSFLSLVPRRERSTGVALIYRAIIIGAAKWIRSNRFPDAIRSDSRSAARCCLIDVL